MLIGSFDFDKLVTSTIAFRNSFPTAKTDFIETSLNNWKIKFLIWHWNLKKMVIKPKSTTEIKTKKTYIGVDTHLTVILSLLYFAPSPI